ncbi:hypothetical protein ILUMI_10967 [Ignelater luminosus]|uniref:Uncharacterized protein n=1 Tax=Ignelater luminosus TaxID=2038154 RepID=A0A8K0D2Y9_IGNLU|nr:hypothetical protein ILUMI_10967 [Ignelater luminosus]
MVILSFPALIAFGCDVLCFFKDVSQPGSSKRHIRRLSLLRMQLVDSQTDVFPDHVFCAAVVTEREENTENESVDVEEDAVASSAAFVLPGQAVYLHEVAGFTPNQLGFDKHVPLSGKLYGSSSPNLPLGNRIWYHKDFELLPGLYQEVQLKLKRA